MSNTFNEYTAYRNTSFTPEEQKAYENAQQLEQALKADPPAEADRLPNGYRKDGQFHLNPMLGFHLELAVNRAKEQLSGWPFPEGDRIIGRFPGVDPLGLMSEVDMSFAQREARIRAAAAIRPREIRDYVGQLLDQAHDKNAHSGVRDMRQEVSKVCVRLRELDRAAKLSLDPKATEILEEGRKKTVESAQCLRSYDNMLTVLEQVTGIRKEPLTAQDRQEMQRLGAPLPEQAETLRKQIGPAPENIAIPFENFDNMTAQQFFSAPWNWGKTPKELPQDIVNLDQATKSVTAYAQATTDRHLSSIFGPLEEKDPVLNSRGDLIIVDGKTVTEHMQDAYRRTHNGSLHGFEDYRAQHLRAFANDCVAAGLMAGKRVEAFLPDANGKLPKTPVQITKEGYEPSPLKKVTLNAWQRHFSKYGFYKEKKAMADEYSRFMAARERVEKNYQETESCLKIQSSEKLYTTGGKRHKTAMFGENYSLQELEHLPNTFKATRTTPQSLFYCAMAVKGYSLEQMTDCQLMDQEMAVFGKEFLQRAAGNDFDYYARIQCEGSMRLLKQVDELHSKVDLTKMESLRENFPVVSLMSDVLFDVSQDMEPFEMAEPFIRRADELSSGHGDALYQEIGRKVSDVSAYFRCARDAFVAESKARLTGGALTEMDCVSIVQMSAAVQSIVPNEKMAFSDRLDAQVSGLAVPAFVETSMHDYLYECKSDPAKMDALRRSVGSGSLRNAFEVEVKRSSQPYQMVSRASVRDENGKVTGVEKARVSTGKNAITTIKLKPRAAVKELGIEAPTAVAEKGRGMKR